MGLGGGGRRQKLEMEMELLAVDGWVSCWDVATVTGLGGSDLQLS